MASDTTQSTPQEPEEAAVWDVVTDLYAAYLDGDRDRLEAHLAPDCTLWDPDTEALLTKADLQAKRAGAPAGPAGRPEPVELIAEQPHIRIFEDVAVETHVLRAVFDDSRWNEELRCSSVLRRIPGADAVPGPWQFVHHHEERRDSRTGA